MRRRPVVTFRPEIERCEPRDLLNAAQVIPANAAPGTAAPASELAAARHPWPVARHHGHHVHRGQRLAAPFFAVTIFNKTSGDLTVGYGVQNAPNSFNEVEAHRLTRAGSPGSHWTFASDRFNPPYRIRIDPRDMLGVIVNTETLPTRPPGGSTLTTAVNITGTLTVTRNQIRILVPITSIGVGK